MKRCQFLYRNNQFMCGQINILIALTDMMPGDGATMVIPGSHKSNFRHPHFATANWHGGESVDGIIGAEEVRNGSLEQFDLVIFPGGSGSRQAAGIGEDGHG